MTTIIPPQQLGFKTFTVSTLLTAETLQIVRNDAREGVYSRSSRSPYPTRLPPWMFISRPLGFGPRQHRSVVSNLVVPNAEVGNNAEKIPGGNCQGGLLARGGALGTAAGSSLGAPSLGAALLATACVSTTLEQQTKAGAVVGAPLISFATFCLLRSSS